MCARNRTLTPPCRSWQAGELAEPMMDRADSADFRTGVPPEWKAEASLAFIPSEARQNLWQADPLGQCLPHASILKAMVALSINPSLQT